MSQIDDNFQGVAKVVKDNATHDITVLLVDPVTGRLLIDVAIESSNDLDISPKIDENYEGVAKAITDDASAIIKPLKVTNSGRLLIDLVIE